MLLFFHLNKHNVYKMLASLKNKDFITIVCIFTIILISGSATWLRAGNVWGGDWPYIDRAFAVETFPIPSYWSHNPLIPEAHRGFGVDGAMTAWMDPLSVVISFIQCVIKSPQLVSRVYLCLNSIILGFCGSYIFIRRVNGPGIFSLMGAISFGFGQYALVGTSGGQLIQGAAISAMPFVMYSFLNYINKSYHLISLILFSGTIMFQAMCDPRFVYLTAFALGIISVSLQNTLKVKLKLIIRLSLVVIISSVIVQAPWITGIVWSGLENALPGGYRDAGWVRLLSDYALSDALNLKHPLFPYPQYGYEDIDRIPNFDWVMFPIITITFFSAGDHKYIGPLTLVYVLTAFLGKGARAPAEDVYAWLFHVVPGMDAFRSPPKWAVVSNLVASPILAVALRILWHHLQNNRNFMLKICIAVELLLVNMAILRPLIIINWFATPEIVSPLYPQDIDIKKQVNMEQNVGSAAEVARILVVPWGGSDVEKSDARQVITLLHLVGGSWSSFTPWAKTLQENQNKLIKSAFFNDLLKISNVRSIVVPNDPERVVFGPNKSGSPPEIAGFQETVDFINNNKKYSSPVIIDNNAIFAVEKPLGPLFITNHLRQVPQSDLLHVGSGAAVISNAESFTESVKSGDLLLSLPEDVCEAEIASVQRLSASRYIVRVHLAQPSWGILSEQFAEGWHAYLVPEKEPVPELVSSFEFSPLWRGAWWWLRPGAASSLDRWKLDNHIRVNGFMQAWHIPTAGSYLLIVEYLPQRAYEGGWLIILVAASVGIAFLVGWATYSGWKMIRGWVR